MIIGYSRVSTSEQNLNLKNDALKEFGCENIYQEKVSSFKSRPELQKALSFLRSGDTFVVWKLDRLARSLTELLQIINDLNSPEQIDIFVRRPVDVTHEKLNVHIIDFEKPEQWKSFVKGDVLFSCLGTTLKAAGSKQAQWQVDYEYQYQFAKAAKENNVSSCVLVSSANASEKSVLFYPKMKGKLDEAVKKLDFQKLIIFKAPALVRKNSDRKMEIMGVKVIEFMNKLGALRSQKPMPTNILAKAMLCAARKLKPRMYEIEGKDIWDFAN